MAKIIKGAGDDAPKRVAPSASGQGVVKRDVYEASNQAQQILSDAEQEAQGLVREAQAEADRIREVAREEGRKEARAEANALLVKARIEREKIIASAEPQLVGLARRIAEKIIGHELEANPDLIVDVVRQAIQTVRQQREISIRVNPSDLEALERRKADLIGVLARAKDVTLRGDADITEGGCIVESELGTIDARLDIQLDVIERILAGEGAA